MLEKKSLTELRGIAQSFGVANIFQLDRAHLLQEIKLKQVENVTPPPIEIPRPDYDARLMTKPPARISDREQIENLLQPHVARGLRLHFDEERWYMSCGKKTDEGTLRMPLRTVLQCAENVLK